jgi:hypothetical protein
MEPAMDMENPEADPLPALARRVAHAYVGGLPVAGMANAHNRHVATDHAAFMLSLRCRLDEPAAAPDDDHPAAAPANGHFDAPLLALLDRSGHRAWATLEDPPLHAAHVRLVNFHEDGRRFELEIELMRVQPDLAGPHALVLHL